MIGDQLFQFSKDQAITTGIQYSTKEQDLGPHLIDPGAGEPTYIVVQVTEAFSVSAGTPALIVHIVLDALQAHLGAPLFTIIGTTVSYVSTELFVGQLIPIALNSLSESQRRALRTSELSGFPMRFLGMQYETAGGTFATGKVTTFLTHKDPRTMMQVQSFDDFEHNVS